MNTKQIKVFLDISVIMAGLASKSGGSHKVLLLAELGIIIPYTSEKVVTEVIRNVEKKLPGCLDLFYRFFRELPFQLTGYTDKNLELAKRLINDKDAPILAAAITAKVDWLLSLDKHFLYENLAEEVNFKIGTPGNFLQDLW